MKVLERAASNGAIVVIDEAYHYFYAPTFMPLIEEYDNLLVLRTFSKLFSMAGLRIGYVSGDVRLIEFIEKAESTFNVNNIAILFAEEVIQNKELAAGLIETEREGRLWLTARLREAGYRTLALEGNFAVIRLRRMSSPIPIQQLPIINTYSPISLPCGAYSEKMRLSCAVMRPDAWDLRYIIN